MRFEDSSGWVVEQKARTVVLRYANRRRERAWLVRDIAGEGIRRVNILPFVLSLAPCVLILIFRAKSVTACSIKRHVVWMEMNDDESCERKWTTTWYSHVTCFFLVGQILGEARRSKGYFLIYLKNFSRVLYFFYWNIISINKKIYSKKMEIYNPMEIYNYKGKENINDITYTTRRSRTTNIIPIDS